MKNNTINLRKKCKRLLVDLELDGMGSRKMLADKISTLEDPVNSNSLTMALTGYRNGDRYKVLLHRVYEYLKNLS